MQSPCSICAAGRSLIRLALQLHRHEGLQLPPSICCKSGRFAATVDLPVEACSLDVAIDAPRTAETTLRRPCVPAAASLLLLSARRQSSCKAERLHSEAISTGHANLSVVIFNALSNVHG
jgi:hypothetical protein